MAGVGIVAKIAHDSITPPASIIPLGDVAFALPLGVNFLLTALIAGRIWYITRGVNSWKHRSAIRIAMEVIVESGALILASQLIFVVLWGIQSNAQNIAVSATLQIYVCTISCSTFNFISLSFLGYRPYSDHRARGDGPFDRDDNGREVRCKQPQHPDTSYGIVWKSHTAKYGSRAGLLRGEKAVTVIDFCLYFSSGIGVLVFYI